MQYVTLSTKRKWPSKSVLLVLICILVLVSQYFEKELKTTIQNCLEVLIYCCVH